MHTFRRSRFNLDTLRGHFTSMLSGGVLLLAGVASLSYATNVGSNAYCKTRTCKKCDASTGYEWKTLSGSACPEVKSLAWAMKIGVAKNDKPSSLVDLSRLGPLEGVVRGEMRDFGTFFASSFNSDPINREAVNIEFDVPSISAALYDPSVLNLHTSAKIIDLKGQTQAQIAAGERQVVTDTVFTEISKLTGANETGFEIKAWNLDSIVLTPPTSPGFYSVQTNGAEPIHHVIFKKPAGATGDNELLIITKERFGLSGVHATTDHYDQDETADTLTMTSYEGEGTSGTIIAKQVVTYSTRGDRQWDYTIEREIYEANTAFDGTMSGLSLIAHNKEVYEDFSEETNATGGEPGARRLMSMIEGFGGDELTTTYQYHDEPSNPYIHGRPKQIVYPNQSWKVYEYSDSPSTPVATNTCYRSYKDVPVSNYQAGIKEITTLSANSVTRIEKIGAQTISSMSQTISKNSVGEYTVTESRSTGTENAVTTRTFYADGVSGVQAGRIKKIEYPDGTESRFTYEKIGEDLTVSESRGAWNGNTLADGVMTETTHNASYQIIEQQNIDYPSQENVEGMTAVLSAGLDNQGRPTKWFYNGNMDDYSISRYGCCGLEYSRDRNGAESTYYRDALKRVYKVVSTRSSGGPVVTTTTSYTGLTTRTERSSAAGTLLVSQSARSINGLSRSMLSPDADNDGNSETTTSLTDFVAAGGPTTTTTYPDDTTIKTVTFLDGRIKKSIDQEGNETIYSYGTHTEQGGGETSTVSLPGSSEQTTIYSDRLGRVFKMVYADDSEMTRAYNKFVNTSQNPVPVGSRGKMKSITDPDNVTVTYAYNTEGEQTTTTVPLPNDTNGNAQERITFSETNVIASVELHGTTIEPAFETVSRVNGVPTNKAYRSIDGRIRGSLSFGRESLSVTTLSIDYQSDHDEDPNTPEVTVNDGAWTTTITSPEGVQSRAYYEDGLMVASVTFESGATLPATAPADITGVGDAGFITGASATHDAFGRVKAQTDARTGTTTMGAYLESGSLLSITAPGTRTTAFTYDEMGRRLTVDAPDTGGYSNKTYTSYTDRGQVRATWGGQTYPLRYEYDEQGRMSRLHTYKTTPTDVLDPSKLAEPTADGDSITTWICHDERGWLVEKNYHGETDDPVTDPTSADYTYTNAGRLETRTWERGVVTTYGYEQGTLTGVTYSGETNGHTTPNLAYEYDAFGRLTEVERGGQSHTSYTYDPVNLLLESENLNQDLPAINATLDRTYDEFLRPQTCSIAGISEPLYSAAYGYDTAGRLETVTNQASKTFTYGYTSKSGSLIESVTGPAHTVTNTWEGDRNILNLKENRENNTGAPIILRWTPEFGPGVKL